MQAKNKELLDNIAAAEEQAHREEISGLVYGGQLGVHDKKVEAVKARREYVPMLPFLHVNMMCTGPGAWATMRRIV
eukprot:m.88762 g.88762  ORF g.88762 m.88762 type:complete len:76 (+) comp9771_c0_seq4:201-428(+)